MAYDVAFTVGYIGMAFIIVCVGFLIDKDHRIMKFVTIMFALAVAWAGNMSQIHLLDAHNATLFNSTATMPNSTYWGVYNSVVGTSDITMWLIYIGLAYFTIYAIYWIAMGLMKKVDKSYSRKGRLGK